MEAPECGNCVCGVSKIGYRCGASIMQNSKWVPGTACPFTTINTLESDLAAKDEEIAKLRERLDRGHEYLMTVEQDEFSADEALEAFGWTADGLNLSPWAEPRAALNGGDDKGTGKPSFVPTDLLEETAIWEWVQRACERSLSPDGFEMWENVYSRLKLSRAALKEVK